ncbi:4-demethylwyosine synthase TYW1 [Candidatus Woesearchaeota archaeon]|nr:4-demethylwyosine synthase TYW1 [Candidatus Woesearchaeota archaeon]
MIISENKRKDLEKQGYRIVGNHSAIKLCMWSKKAIKCEDVCYKNTFYGIETHRCVQMTPALPYCGHRCVFCWRDIAFTEPKWNGPVDEPKEIINGCIEAQVKYLQGFGGNDKADQKKYKESLNPLHFAISLSGEPTLYPRLPELIDEITKRGMTSFLVTNGTNPEMLEKIKGHEPTQLYLTLPAPDKESYIKTCHPIIKDSWEKILESIKIYNKINTRKTIRLTLVKNINLIKPEKYAELFKKIEANFFELKAYVWVGHSRKRLAQESMPMHHEIVEFAKMIIKNYPDLKIIDEKAESRVVLLAKKDFNGRIMRF